MSMDASQAKPLTPRERDVAMLVGQGQTSKQAARVLGISDLTVRKHRENIMSKLGLHETSQLVRHFAAQTKRDEDVRHQHDHRIAPHLPGHEAESR